MRNRTATLRETLTNRIALNYSLLSVIVCSNIPGGMKFQSSDDHAINAVAMIARRVGSKSDEITTDASRFHTLIVRF